MREIILKYTSVLILLISNSCGAQNSVYSNEDISKLKIAYNKLIDDEYKDKPIVISDSISSGHLEIFYGELYKKEGDELRNEQKFYSSLRELDKQFKVRDSFQLKKILNNHNEKGDYVFFISKIVEDILTISVYELNHSVPDTRKIRLYNYPYSKLFFKSPKKVYFFKFNERKDFDFMEAPFFWQ